jgi:hypothetical protein
MFRDINPSPSRLAVFFSILFSIPGVGAAVTLEQAAPYFS